ncbi:hypothetical protein [Bradyrhizobium sp.]|uniref:hypothetical protein n=1 Tax=Bradyrhizobium sp. TaxID=376 RepID=UPI001D8E6AD8|nr:hypothetical protein [Bradyrhizobium sp.]MBI5320510.1 hypothetical protein [Bradyrhizobium sp.]
MDPQDARPPKGTGPVAWFERISLLGDDFRKIGKASIVPAVLLAALFPALVDQLTHPGQFVYLAAVRTFPLTATIAVIWISAHVWNTSTRLNWYALLAIWCVSLYISISLALHFGCSDCGKLSDIQEETYAWLPQFARQAGISAVAFLVTAGIYFFRIYGWASFLASLICGSYLGLAGIYVLRPGGPLDRGDNSE